MLRSVRLFRLFLREQADPDGFYTAIAHDAASQLTEFTDAAGKTVLDIGGGAGYVTAEFRSRGANCYLLELDAAEMMVRATRPGGLIYLSFTNWYSPWGGHEMSPWHYLGAGRAERRYRRKHGRLPKNAVGSSLFPLHIGPVLRMMRARADVEVVAARPRYYPDWCWPLLLIPGLREIATWNLMLILRRTG